MAVRHIEHNSVHVSIICLSVGDLQRVPRSELSATYGCVYTPVSISAEDIRRLFHGKYVLTVAAIINRHINLPVCA